MKETKAKVYADLIEHPDRLEALIHTRKKTRKWMHISSAIVFGGTFMVVVGSLFDNASVGPSLSVMAIFLAILLFLELEWQLLHVLRRLSRDERMSDRADQPGPAALHDVNHPLRSQKK